MMRTTKVLTPFVGCVALCLLAFTSSFDCHAGIVTYSSISQSGQGPGDPSDPYGSPTISGNLLSFLAPGAFSATSANGVFDIADSFTDGFISFSVEAEDNTWITGFSLREQGSRNLFELVAGSGTIATTVRVIALGSISVTELDHGSTPLTAAAATPFGIGFDVTWDLINDPTPALWDAFDEVDIEQILTNRGVVFDYGATAFDFFMNNQLLAISEDGTFAFIDKKRIDFDTDTEMIPEPATLVLAIGGILGIACSRKRVG